MTQKTRCARNLLVYRSLTIFFFISLELLAPGMQGQDQAFPSTDFIVRGVRLFDGRTSVPDVDVVIQHNLIETIGTKLGNPNHLLEVDGRGKTLLPGLIDAHAHAYTETHLRTALIFGVTTELDMFSLPDFIHRMKQQEEAGQALDRADVRSAGIWVSAPGGYSTLLGLDPPTLAGPDQAKSFVDDRIREGSDYIKVVYDNGSEYGMSIPSLSRETLLAVVKEAHARGKLVVAHVESQQAAREAVELGVDGLMHSFMDQAPDPELISLLKAKAVFVVPTLSIEASLVGEPSGRELANDSSLRPYLEPDARVNLSLAFPRANSRIRYENAQSFVRLLHLANVSILGGTDAPNPGTWHGAGLHGELVRLVDAGLSPAEALASVTSGPSQAFHLADRGEISQGKRADLLLVEGDPTHEIKDLRRIVAIWKQGVYVDRQPFRDAVAKADAKAESFRSSPTTKSSVIAKALISDFEDGTAATRFGSPWIPLSDALMGIGGKSKGNIRVVAGGAEGSAHCLEVSGEIDGALAYAWAGAAFLPSGSLTHPADVSAHQRLVFWTKGTAKTFRILLFTKRRGIFPASLDVAVTDQWQKQSLALSDFGVDGKQLLAIVFAGGPEPGTFSFQIDNISLE